jgi:hypothetical protein
VSRGFPISTRARLKYASPVCCSESRKDVWPTDEARAKQVWWKARCRKESSVVIVFSDAALATGGGMLLRSPHLPQNREISDSLTCIRNNKLLTNICHRKQSRHCRLGCNSVAPQASRSFLFATAATTDPLHIVDHVSLQHNSNASRDVDSPSGLGRGRESKV